MRRSPFPFFLEPRTPLPRMRTRARERTCISEHGELAHWSRIWNAADDSHEHHFVIHFMTHFHDSANFGSAMKSKILTRFCRSGDQLPNSGFDDFLESMNVFCSRNRLGGINIGNRWSILIGTAGDYWNVSR